MDFKGRREDLRLVTGQGRYTADWNLPGQLYGCFLRSDRAHAEITTLDTRAAAASAGVVAVLTGDDFARTGIKTSATDHAFQGQGRLDAQGPAAPRPRPRPGAFRR